jgi:hypothetical protein
VLEVAEANDSSSPHSGLSLLPGGIDMPPKHDINHLEKEIRTLQATLKSLVAGPDLEALLLRIHGPGWTTPAEFALVSSSVVALNHVLGAAAVLKTKVIEAGEMVGRG